ncbi:dienelactone hydrolase family protein [Cellulomonas sp. ES6]|uniref:alpha/beta hydrolase n=1 Tax=Cellulomonas sp. ES6 TaxID=3039384 RepID=UPI0024B6AB32|nr:dienelactone hydrolase family protein [Cellulomonas sp. ES6]WHP18351.1 dienelactone hydrolase family protein [Cellulomonas sp. ES6]
MPLRVDPGPVRTAGATAPGAPVLVLLHGYGSHEGDLLGLAPSLPRELALVAPRGPLRGGPGYAWAPLATPGRPDPAAVRDAADALLTWLDGAVDPARPLALLGFSQGGLLATQVLRARPGRITAAVVLSGFALDTEEPGDAELAGLRVPVLFGHGDADTVIPADATARTAAWLARHTAAEHHTYPGLGHGIGRDGLADVAAFLERTVVAGTGARGGKTA